MPETATAATVKARVTASFHHYQTEGTDPRRPQFNRARRGDVVEVTADELARGEELGTLEAVDTADDDDATTAGPSDAELLEQTARVAGIAPTPGSDPTVTGDAPTALARLAQRVTGESTVAGDADGGTAATVDDEGLRAMSAAEVVAYLNQHPDDVDRVDALEAERDTRRVTVDKAIEAHRDASTE